MRYSIDTISNGPGVGQLLTRQLLTWTLDHQRLLSRLHNVFDYLPFYIIPEIWFGAEGRR